MRLALLAFVPLTLFAACSTSVTDEDDGGSSGTSGSGAGAPAGSDALVQAALFIGSCVPDDGVNRWLNNLNHGRGDVFTDADLACFAGKTNGCAAVEECTGLSVALDGPCEDTCVDGEWNACDGMLHFSGRCDRFGMECSPERGECVEEPVGPACDYMTFVQRCDGDAEVSCRGGYEMATDCTEQGQSCSVNPDNDVAGCTGAGPTCTGFSEDDIRCDGAAIVSCENGGEHRVDCAELNGAWSCFGQGYAAHCAEAEDCDPTDSDQATCDGDTITFCNAGRVATESCIALGFERCFVTSRGAVCAPSVWDP